jgi:hypothetical protein
MSKSTSRIIETIEKQKGFFTVNDIMSAVLLPPSKSKKSKKTNKLSQRQAQQTASRVQDAVTTLYQYGFLTKQKGKFKVAHPLNFTGTFIHNKKGDGVVYLHDDIEVHIYRDDVHHARNKDIVQVQLTDIRRGTLFGKVTSIVTANKRDVLCTMYKTQR